VPRAAQAVFLERITLMQLAPESGQPLGARAVANQAADLDAIGTKPLGKPTAHESGPSAEKSFHTDPYGARLRRAQTTGERVGLRSGEFVVPAVVPN
jgi:hypothetical protein